MEDVKKDERRYGRVCKRRVQSKFITTALVTVFVIASFFMFTLAISAQPSEATLISSASSLTPSLLYYEPVPAQPGDLITVWINIENIGGDYSKAGTLTVLESGPFTVDGDSERVKKFSRIPSQNSFLVNTRVRIDKDAHEGTNYLTVRVSEGDSDNYIEKDLPITIQGKSSTLSIIDVKTVPSSFSPGKKGEISLLVKNVGETTLRNVNVELNLKGLSVAPTGTSSSKTISMLKGNEVKEFNFSLTPYPNADAQVVSIPVTLSYEDEQDNSKNQSEEVGLAIGSTPELLVYFEKTAINPKTLEGSVVVKFVNKGLNKIKLLQMTVPKNDNADVISDSSTIYVGDIDIDDYESADLTLKIAKSEVTVPIKVQYRDALNNQYTGEYDLQLRAKSTNRTSTSRTWWIVLIVVVIGIIIWFFRRKRRIKK